MRLKLFDKHNLKDLPTIDTDDAKYAAAYLIPLIENGVEKYFDNIQGEMKILCIDNTWLLPVFIPATNYRNAYVASVYSHYISYCLDELGELKSKTLQLASKLILCVLGGILKAVDIDKTVYINNWLLSTNLYTDLPTECYKPVTEFISRVHKGYTVIWNSINQRTTADAYQELKRQGYLFLPSRSVYILDRFEGFPRSIRREIRWDTKLLHDCEFGFEDAICASDILALYNNLYIKKYSHYNPKFTSEYIAFTQERSLINYLPLIATDGKAAGIIGYFSRKGVMTTPILGYDFSYDKSVGLYRRLSIKLFYEAKENGQILHCSSGVGRFKMARGSERFWEYRVVCTENISRIKRLAFRLLQLIIARIGVPMMDKLKL